MFEVGGGKAEIGMFSAAQSQILLDTIIKTLAIWLQKELRCRVTVRGKQRSEGEGDTCPFAESAEDPMVHVHVWMMINCNYLSSTWPACQEAAQD